MSQQLGLPGFDADPAPVPRKASGDTLFFALRPDAPTADRIVSLATRLRSQHGLNGRVQTPDRLHITLRALGAFDDGLASLALNVAGRLTAPAVDVMLDRAMSFPGSGALVLVSSDNAPAVAALRRQLALSLGDSEKRAARSETPHMTLLYDRQHSIEPCDVEPVRWRALQLVLVRSHVGQSIHETLGSWPLTVDSWPADEP